MQYELAKELKDAGFPMDYELDNFTEFDKQGNWINIDLSELIEACGHYFYQLTKEDDGSWTCASINGYPKSGFGVTNSPTPEEAVAKLWLALNKK